MEIEKAHDKKFCLFALSFLKSAIVLKSGFSFFKSQITSMLRVASSSNLLDERILFK